MKKLKVHLPKKLKIGVHNYNILFPHTFEEREDCKGLHDSAQHRIWIAGKCDQHSAWVTLFHEVLHAVDEIAGHNHLAQLEENTSTQHYVDALAEGIYQFLVDNDLFKRPK